MSLHGDSPIPNYQCNGRIDADPDIAGTGVFYSFIAIAWITVISATLKAIFGYVELTEQASHLSPTSPISRVSQLCSVSKEICNDFALSLCDLQAFTGTAILLTRIILRETISYYHQEYVIMYWWLTINSFWAANFQHDDDEIENDWFSRIRQKCRNFLVLLSVLLGIYCQSKTIWVELHQWDTSDGKRCFLYIERWYYPWETWFWAVGLSLYALALGLSMFKQGGDLVNRYERVITDVKKGLWAIFERKNHQLRDLLDMYAPPSGRTLSIVVTALTAIFFGALAILFWLLVQILSIWAWSDGNRQFHIIMFNLFAVRSTQDLVTHRKLNWPIVDGQEHSLGFGQWLPIIMVVSVIYNLFLSYRPLTRRTHRRNP